MSNLDQTASEQAILGACMSVVNPKAFLDAAVLIQGEDFYRPHHALVWDAIAQLHIDGIPADPVILADRLGVQLAKVGGPLYLADLFQHACPSIAVSHHAQLVADAATSRRLLVAGQRIAQRAEDADADPAELVRWSMEQVSAARDQRMGVEVLTEDYATFINSTPEDRVMVIPGLMGVGDRMVLTGQGGLGKTTLALQLCVCAAGGLPPFDWHAEDTYEPQRVSVLNFELEDHLMKTRLWPIVKDCRDLGVDPVANLSIGGHGNPLDVLNPQNALSLLRTIEHDKPDLVYVGPLYKMHNADPDKEAEMKKIGAVLDSIRGMGVAIITEAHHTKEGKKGGSLEPSGAAFWTWWPEFGLGMRLVDGERNQMLRRCVLERWRIDRIAASWPQEIESSGKHGLAWARADGPRPAGRPEVGHANWAGREVAS